MDYTCLRQAGTLLAIVIFLLSLFANLSTGSSSSFSQFTFYCHGISSSVLTRKWTRPRFVGQAGFTSLPAVDRVIARSTMEEGILAVCAVYWRIRDPENRLPHSNIAVQRFHYCGAEVA